MHYGIINFLNIIVWWAAYQIGKEGEARRWGAVMSNPLSDKPPLIRCGETYSTSQQ